MNNGGAAVLNVFFGLGVFVFQLFYWMLVYIVVAGIAVGFAIFWLVRAIVRALHKEKPPNFKEAPRPVMTPVSGNRGPRDWSQHSG